MNSTDKKINLDAITLFDLQPSQFYISEKKLQEVDGWFNAADLSNFEPIPVKMLDGLPVMTDGHTRAVTALLAGLDRVPLVWDEDELDWDMYRKCVEECRRFGIKSPVDLLNMIIPEEEYEIKWDKWCDEMHAELISSRVVIEERGLNDDLLARLIELSGEWEAENSCRGYRKNEPSDIEGRRVFVASDGNEVVGYLFGLSEVTKERTSVTEAGTPVFEVEEIYVRPPYRNYGLGRRLFACCEKAVQGEADYITLSTATRNWKAILHFYLDELDMEFWNARLFKKTK